MKEGGEGEHVVWASEEMLIQEEIGSQLYVKAESNPSDFSQHHVDFHSSPDFDFADLLSRYKISGLLPSGGSISKRIERRPQTQRQRM